MLFPHGMRIEKSDFTKKRLVFSQQTSEFGTKQDGLLTWWPCKCVRSLPRLLAINLNQIFISILTDISLSCVSIIKLDVYQTSLYPTSWFGARISLYQIKTRSYSMQVYIISMDSLSNMFMQFVPSFSLSNLFVSHLSLSGFSLSNLFVRTFCDRAFIYAPYNVWLPLSSLSLHGFTSQRKAYLTFSVLQDDTHIR